VQNLPFSGPFPALVSSDAVGEYDGEERESGQRGESSLLMLFGTSDSTEI
jgi:hypothetical protein